MKKTIAISMLALTTGVTAQIKIFPGGLQAYGSTTSPASGEKHHFTGDFVVAEAGNTTTGCALIRANGATNLSSVSRPDFTWLGNNNAGIFHPASNIIGITLAGGEKFRFSGGQLLSSATQAAATPAYSWNSDANTGLYNPSADVLGFVTNGTEKMRLNPNGNLGIGNNNPTDRLHVTGNSRLNGNVIFDNWTDVTIDWSGAYGSAVITPENDWYLHLGTSTKYLGGAYITNIFTRNTITFTSDQSVKQNINYNVTNVISKLKQLKPASYNFKSNLAPGAPASVQASMSARTEYGLIAQDLITVFPELVEKDPTTNLYGVKYIEFIPLLINAFNLQQNTIDSLKQQINDCCSKPTGSRKTNRLINSSVVDGNNITNESQSFIMQNKPNPFSNETIIEYNIVSKSNTSSIMIFDMNGKHLKTYQIKEQGKGQLTINGKELSAGLYHYSLVIDGQEIDTKKMIINE